MINSFLNKFNKWWVAVPLSILLFAGSCTSDEKVAPETEYSGEEIFQGLFFWEGELANKMEALKPGAEQLRIHMDETQRLEYQEFMNEIITQVRALDPGYFAKLKKEMQSDNLYEIELALTNAQSMFEAAGKRSKYADHFNLLTEIKEKDVDLKKFEHLDLTKEEDTEMFAQIFKNDYGIDLEGMESSVGRGQCIAVFVVAVVAGNIAYVVNVAAAWNVAMAANFTKVQNYNIPRLSPTEATAKALISELASVIN